MVRDVTTGQPLVGAVITAKAALPGNTSAWPATALGQANPQTSAADGVFALIMPGGPNRLEVARDGYQPYRSLVFDDRSATPSVALTSAISAAPTHRIYITETGFEPAVLRAPVGSVIEWVNLSLSERTTTGANGIAAHWNRAKATASRWVLKAASAMQTRPILVTQQRSP